MIKNLSLIFAVSISLFLSGCTWVNLSEAGKDVAVGKLEFVKDCKKLGKTNVSVKYKVAGLERKKETMELELEMLARNEAAAIKGNVIVPFTEITDGKRSFYIYDCPR